MTETQDGTGAQDGNGTQNGNAAGAGTGQGGATAQVGAAGQAARGGDHPLLDRENEALDRLMPGLREALTSAGLMANEGPESTAIAEWRASGGTQLIVPEQLGGRGASAVDAVRVQTALGALAPSLAAATTMHHLSSATLFEAAGDASDDERALIRALVEDRVVMASGFSEGMPGGSVFRPTMTARREGDEYVLEGAKKPCSLARSMDMIVAGALVDESERAVALIPAGSEGMRVEDFWATPALKAAESEAVVLDGVRLDASMLFLTSENDPDNIHEMTGYQWFGLLISACYLGVAFSLLESAAAKPTVDPRLIATALAEAETMRTALLALAADFDAGARGGAPSARLMLVRWAMRDGLVRLQSTVREALGGFGYMQDPSLAYRFEAAQVFGFHPPSRRETAENLLSHARGGDFFYV